MIVVHPNTSGRLGNHLFHAAYAWDLAYALGGVVSYQEPPEGAARAVIGREVDGTMHEVLTATEGHIAVQGIWVRPSAGAYAIRSTFSQPEPLDSIAVHIRRGDYIDLGCALPDSYYSRAIDLLTSKVGPLPVCVFSDDPAIGTGNSPEGDLIAMAACRHHVISNSTFSWWGAFLGERPRQVVIAPSRWRDSLDTSGMLPPHWITLA